MDSILDSMDSILTFANLGIIFIILILLNPLKMDLMFDFQENCLQKKVLGALKDFDFNV